MTSKELGIVTTCKKFNSKIEKLKLTKEVEKENYVNKYRKFIDGEKIKIITPEIETTDGMGNCLSKTPVKYRFAYIHSAFVDEESGEIMYQLCKPNEDGTNSFIPKGYYTPVEILEKI